MVLEVALGGLAPPSFVGLLALEFWCGLQVACLVVAEVEAHVFPGRRRPLLGRLASAVQLRLPLCRGRGYLL